MAHPFFNVPVPTILGHRGAAGEAPQNTLPSFALALEQGAHILESDVHATADGVAVLVHDPVVDGVTETTGKIADFALAELVALDAGYRFTPDEGASFPQRGRGISIPTLEAAFAEFADQRFNLEIKSADAVDATLDWVAKFGRADRTLLVGAEAPVQEAIRAGAAARGIEPAISASLPDILAFIASAQKGEAPPKETMALQIPTEFGGNALINEALLSHAHAHDILVHAWTINEPDEMNRLLDLGVDGLVTDFPARAARVLEQRGR